MSQTPAPFLKGYQLILFDMDGVITSEQRYWDASALAVWQLLFPQRVTNPAACTEQVASIRNTVFCGDQTIRLLKDRGVNSNWDLTYVVYATATMLTCGDDFQMVLYFLRETPYQALELYQFLAKESGVGGREEQAYQTGVSLFQEWYLGDKLYREQYQLAPSIAGKPGLFTLEQPILPIETIQTVLRTLHEHGFHLGIGTGRVSQEIQGPLFQWDIAQYFDANRLINYTHVQQAEKSLPGNVLTKPHPYLFLKGVLGDDYSDRSIIEGTFDRSAFPNTLVVGDAGADLLSAQQAGLDFAAVLTGVAGADAKRYFEQQNATFILNSIADMVQSN